MLDHNTRPSVRLQQAEVHAQGEKTSEPFDSSVDPYQSLHPADAVEVKGAWRDLFYFTDRSDTPYLVLATISSIAASVPTPAQAFFIGKIFDEFITYAAGRIAPHELLDREQRWVLYLTIVAIGTWVFHSLEFTTWMFVGERQARRARQQLYDTMSRKSISWFDMQKQGIAALLPQLGSQIADMQLASSQPFGGLITSIFTALISLGQAFYLSWSLTLVTLATSPLIFVVMGLFGSGIQSAFDKQHTSLSEAQKISLDALTAIDSVKYFNTQDTELTKYKDKVRAAAGHYIVVSNKTALQMGCLTFLVQAMFVQAFYYGGVLISRGEKSPAEVVTTFFSAIAAFQAIQGVLPQLIVLEKGRSSAAILKATLLDKSGSVGPVGGRNLRPLHCGGSMRLHGVTFCYPALAGQQALSNVSLTFQGGSMTFVIGKSGSGKSTIGQLLVRFYSPERGQVSLDGLDLNDLDQKWLRSKVTLLEQTSNLFSGTILANLQLVRSHGQQMDDGDIQTAVEFALLQSMISDLPSGLNTLVGGGGASLSGGQCQRVALARARLRDTPILILDESTSALDKITRDLIMDAIRQWRRGKTTIVITHEISQIRAADYVIVMEAGHMVQEGYREDLEAMSGSPFEHFMLHDQGKMDLTQNRSSRRQPVRKAPTQELLRPHARVRADDRTLRRFPAIASSASLRFPGIPVSLASLTVSPESCRDSTLFLDARDQLKPPSHSSLVISRPSIVIEDTRGPAFDHRFSLVTLEKHVMKTGSLATMSRKMWNARGRTVSASVVKSPTAGSEELAHCSPSSLSTSRSIAAILRSVWPILPWQSRVYLLLGFWGGTVHGVCSPVFAYVLAKLMALYAVKDDHSRQSMIYSLAILALAITDGIHFYLCRFMLDRAAQDWVDQNRIEALRRLLHQPRAYFDRPENVVLPIVQELDRSGEEMRNLLGRFAGLLYIAGIIVLSSVIWALTTQWKMTLIALATAPYVFVTTYIYSKGSEYLESLSKQASVAVSLSFEETFRNVRTVRALLLESHFHSLFVKAVAHTMQIGRQRAAKTGLLYGFSDSSSAFSIAFVFYIGSKLVSSGADVMSVVQVFIVLIFAITNVTAVLGYIPQIGSAKVTANRILDIANIEEKSHEGSGDIRLTFFGNVEFHNVTFAYPTRPQTSALKDITFTIKHGHSVAIVGGSGSGKSTVAKLILKLYDTQRIEAIEDAHTSGLRIAGRYVQDIETSSLRNAIGVVSQSNALFPGTIAENITYGLSDGSHNAQHGNVALAASQAGVLDFINSLPAGFETRIGDGGMGLSGGQAQRLAIARALVRRPHALILDEATSALDVESAATIRTTIAQLVESAARDMTIIIITHAKEMMELAEQIVVLDGGRLVQCGSYQELISQPGPLLHLLSSGVWDPTQEDESLG